jgi:menaquinone-dependent protoporphyrinogen oxidase
MSKILVTYASRAGSTTGVAERIGKVLTKLGEEVTLKPMTEVNDLKEYDAIVAGSAIQAASWLPEAMDFIRKNQEVFMEKPCATFSVCMTMAMSKAEKYRAGVVEWLTPVRALTNPVSEGIFAGALDLKKVKSASDRFKFRLSILFGVWQSGDHRKWDKIEQWASRLPEQFNDTRLRG